MPSSVGLEVMESSNGELSWKSVTKGRRSKKSVVRSMNSFVKLGSSIGPKTVGDFSGSDSDKLSEVIPGQETSGKSDNVPLKKRRHLLQSPSPHPWASSLHTQDSAPLKTLSSSPLLEDRVRLQYPSYSAGDFFGIELLAAAASMDDVIDGADKKDILPEDSSVQKNSDVSLSATLSKQCLKPNESVDSLSNINLPGGDVDSQENNSSALQSSSASPEDDMGLKVDRKHWDLNTSMDAWSEPYDDSISGDALKDPNVCRHMEMEKHFGDHVSSIQISITDDKPNLGIEQDGPTSAAEHGICSEPPHLKGNLLDTPTNIYSHIVRDTSNQACQKDPDDKNLNKALTCDADLERWNQVASLDAAVSISPLCCSSGMIKSEEKDNSVSGTVATFQHGDCSSSVSECERTAAVNGSHTRTDEVNAHDTAASKSAINVKPEHEEVYQKTSSTGTSTVDDQPVASTDSNKQTDGAFLSNSTMADCKQYLKLAELGTRHDEDCILPNGNSKITVSVDTCKSSSSGAQCDEPIVEGIGLPVDGQHASYVSQANHADMVNGDDLTGFQEGYDSPYEDGELRGSFLDSWEDSEMENNCVDYESDGRHGDGSDAAAYNGSEIVEGGFEGSNGSRGSLSLKISAEGNSKIGNVKHALKKHVVKFESYDNDMAGKGSNAGSGSTVEQCVEMHMDENDGIRRLELLDHKNAVDVRATRVDEYASKAVKGKLQSRIEGRSSAEATDGKDAFSIQQSRSRRFTGSYPRPERDISPDRYLGRYRSAAPGERDGVHQWTSWGSRRHYTANYLGGEERNNAKSRIKIGQSANKIDDLGYHERRQTSYLSKAFNRPLMRRSPGERDDYFGVGRRRIQPTQVVGNYRIRGHYSQHSGRDFVADFAPLPDSSVHMPRYISRREHSLSSGPGRPIRTFSTRRRSRSRSRTRSPPRAWQNSHRERILERRRLNRCSPDFRTDSRMGRRMPYSKPVFASDYGEGYISPSRGRLSPQRNCRWVEDDDFADNHATRRRALRRFDDVPTSSFSSRLKAGEYSRHVIRPGRRMSFKGESNYDDRRRHDGGGEMSRRVVGGNMRRFRGNDLETKNMNDEDDDFEREEDKKAYKI